MPKKNTPLPVVLPARMSLKADAFNGFKIAVLEMPYQEEINLFLSRLKSVLRKSELAPWQYPPYRLLNSAIIACAPTLVHGFEKVDYYAPRQMLAVSRSVSNTNEDYNEVILSHPTEEQLAQLIRLWINIWPSQQEWLAKCIKSEGKDAWNDFQKALLAAPQTTWRDIDATSLINNISAENSLGYRAIPSLLATLLDNTTTFIGEQERLISWRKMQDSDNRLAVTSNPLPISFTRKVRFTEKSFTGFFTYKLEFQMQTQAGRKEPWIHVFLRCQRYAEERLTQNKRGSSSELTIFVGMNQERLEGWGCDSTLVRLKAKPYLSEKHAGWADQLSNLLAAFKARPLEPSFQLYQNPQNFWKKVGTQRTEDEYYILHTEGYKYGRGGHSVMTGFGLPERSEVIEQACCGSLGQVLQPDTYFQPDTPSFGKSFPLTLWTFNNLAQAPSLMSKPQAQKAGLSTKEQRCQERDIREQAQRTERQAVVVKAVQRALRGEKLVILVIYREKDTCDVLLDHLRNAFLLNEDDLFPENVCIIPKQILDATLCQPLDMGELSPEVRSRPASLWPDGFLKNWENQLLKARQQKLQAWGEFLSDLTLNDDACYTAIIELPKEPESTHTFHVSQSIKGIVREACARKGITSQMLHPVKWVLNKKLQQRILSDAENGRVTNTVHEVTNRHIGGLYGTPAEIYKQIGIPGTLSQELDVIAFCLQTTQTGVRYGCAVRLQASGTVDVLLPGDKEQWQTYVKAGPNIGYRFAEARKDLRNGKIPDKSNSKIRLSADELSRFIEETVTQHLARPTLIIVEASKWRNKSNGGWTQLQNPILSSRLDKLEFGKIPSLQVYNRDDSSLNNIVAIIRLRQGDETPQYITNRDNWQKDEERPMRDLYQLSGFIDRTTTEVFHYFSIGRLQATIKGSQARRSREDPYKLEDGGGIAFKHQQMIEIVPFFVHQDFSHKDGLKALCRVPHYLRFSPAWSMGNVILPYPMHLGNQLIEDQLCILGNEG